MFMDWLGLTLTVITNVIIQDTIVITDDGLAMPIQIIDVEVLEIDMVEAIMECFGENAGIYVLDALLETRDIVLGYTQ